MIIPWVECNDDKPETIEKVILGASGLEDVIVTSTPGKIRKVSSEIRKIVKFGHQLIGGIKTHGYARVRKWTEYSDGLISGSDEELPVLVDFLETALRARNMTVVLENERLLRGFHETGRLCIREFCQCWYRIFRNSILEPWFYFPEVLGDSDAVPERQMLTERLVEGIAQNVPNAKFLVGYRSWFGWEANAENVRLMERMEFLVGKERVIYIVRVRTDKPAKRRPAYTPEQFAKVRKLYLAENIVLYTGFDEWVNVMARKEVLDLA